MRQIWQIGGEDRVAFLQALVTNDVHRLEAEGIQWAALLTPQGKYLADFFLIWRPEVILLDIDADLAEATIKRLTMYRLRSKVSLEPSGVKLQRGTGPAPDGALADPRDPRLGWRLYGEAEGDDGSDFNALRVELLVPETGMELGPETYILEAGFERLHGVDFRKGCFVGQEVTARMKHKTELKKGLMRVRLGGAAEPGAEIRGEDGRVAGRLHTVAGERAIAWLRFDRLQAPLYAGEATVSADETVSAAETVTQES